jgi:ADP-heptose:LPS heptosyltransferase
MSMGEARAMYKRMKLPVLITGIDGRPVQSDLMAGVHYLIQTRPAIRGMRSPVGWAPMNQRLVNGPNARPYIAGKSPEKWTWRAYKPIPADIVFTYEEQVFAEPYRGMIMLEPTVKNVGHHNKDWGPINWQQLDSKLHSMGAGYRTVQCGPQGTRWLLHTEPVITDTFRKACAILSVCRAFVGAEGGLMHAAAAVKVPAVIIFGGFISPQVTGYAQNRNLFTGTGLGCGMRIDCSHCHTAMARITPNEVLANLKEIL